MSSLAGKLARAREVVAKATPGPYELDKMGGYLWTPKREMLFAETRGYGHLRKTVCFSEVGAFAQLDANGEMLVLAVNALPALLDAVEALLALRGEYVGVEDMLPHETSVHVQAIDAALARLSEVLP